MRYQVSDGGGKCFHLACRHAARVLHGFRYSHLVVRPFELSQVACSRVIVLDGNSPRFEGKFARLAEQAYLCSGDKFEVVLDLVHFGRHVVTIFRFFLAFR